MGMGMSMSLQIWQLFVDLVFQDGLIKGKQNFDVIMDDTFIHSTEEAHMDDRMDLFKVLWKCGLKISPHKCQIFKKKFTWDHNFKSKMTKFVIPLLKINVWQFEI